MMPLGSGPAFVCLLVALLSAAAAVAQPVTSLQLALWDSGLGGERELVGELVRGFQRDNEEMLVCSEWRKADHSREMMRRWLGSYRDHAPDMVVLSDRELPEFLADVTRLPGALRQRVMTGFPESVLARMPAAGAPVGVPWSVETEAVYYRSDLLAEAGLSPPATFAELADCAVALADPPHRFGLGLPGPGMGGEELLHVLATAMGRIEAATPAEGDEAPVIGPTLQPFADALSFLVDVQSCGGLEPEVLTWSEIELAGLMVRGRLGMMLARPWLAAVLDRAEASRQKALKDAVALGEDGAATAEALRAAKVEWDTVPLPFAEDGRGHVRVDWLVVLETTDAAEQCFRFAEFMASEDSQRALSMLGGVPATTALAREMSNDPRWGAHLSGLDGASGLPIGQWQTLGMQLGDALAHAISGRRTPAEALERSAEIR